MLKQNNTYFKALYDIAEIIVIGHSLSTVDYPYFKEIINSNINRENLFWKISYHNEADLKRINNFIGSMNIKSEQVNLFKL